ncbi:MAG TPA: alpha/beta hydrolase [Anaerolineae bacterium]|nr:alpha/beta hydrolase [Anaerolineae bacterium]
MPKAHVNDIDLYYESTGQGQPVLLIHGLGSSARDWEPQTEAFSPLYRVVTFDVRGHGQSDKPPGPYSIPLFAVDTADLIRSLGIGPSHVVGISMGGMIAFQLAVSSPDLVKSLVIVNSGPEMIVRTFQDRLRVFQRSLLAQIFGIRKIGEFLGPRLFPKPEQESMRQMFIERWAENDQRAYLDAFRGLLGWSISDLLHTIICPTLVIASDEDYTPVSTKEAYVDRLRQGELVVIQDARHAVTIERPQEFNKAVLDFLSRQI